MKKSVKIVIAIIAILVIIGIAIFAVASGKKKVATMEKFEKVVQEVGYNVAGVLGSQKGEESPIVEEKAAINEDYTALINFYILKDEEAAKNLYDENKTKFEQNKKEEDAPTENNKKNYANYTLKSNGKYNYTARIGNTVVDITANEDKEQEVKEFIKKLGY